MKKTIYVGVLILLAILALWNGVKAQELSEQVANCEQTIESLRTKLSDMEEENSEYFAKIKSYESVSAIAEKKREIFEVIDSIRNAVGAIEFERAEEVQKKCRFLLTYFPEEIMEMSSQEDMQKLTKFGELDLDALQENVDKILRVLEDIHDKVSQTDVPEELLRQENRLLELESEFGRLGVDDVNDASVNQLMQYCKKAVFSLPLEEVEASLISNIAFNDEEAFLWSGLEYSKDFLVSFAEILAVYPTSDDVSYCEDCGIHCCEIYEDKAEWAMPMVREILSSSNCSKRVRIALAQTKMPLVLNEIAKDFNTSSEELEDIYKRIESFDVYDYGYCSFFIAMGGDDGMTHNYEWVSKSNSMKCIFANPNCSPELREIILEKYLG